MIFINILIHKWRTLKKKNHQIIDEIGVNASCERSWGLPILFPRTDAKKPFSAWFSSMELSTPQSTEKSVLQQ